MKPLLLLDIDGVCLPFEETTEPTRFVVFTSFSETQRVEEKLVERIQRLFEIFEVVWCTAWTDPEILAAALEIDIDTPRIEISGQHKNDWITAGTSLADTSWKLGSVELWDKTQKASRPLVWIDDEELSEDSQRWAKSRSGETLLLETDANVGISDLDMIKLETFAKLSGGTKNTQKRTS